MTGYTPEQLPVLNGIAREFGVFDHWFSRGAVADVHEPLVLDGGDLVGAGREQPRRRSGSRRTTPRRSSNGSSSTARPGRSTWWSRWRSRSTGVIHYPRLKDRLATHVVPFAEFERDAAAGTLPDFSLIEPNLIAGHGDYHPAFGRSLGHHVDAGSAGPAVLDAAPAKPSCSASSTPTARARRNRARTSGTPTLLIGWDEPGGTYDHVPPGPGSAARPERTAGRDGIRVRPLGLPRPRDPRLALGPAGLRLQRRVPAHLADRHAAQGLGPRRRRSRSATPRRAAFDDLFTLDEPRDPQTWATDRRPPGPGLAARRGCRSARRSAASARPWGGASSNTRRSSGSSSRRELDREADAASLRPVVLDACATRRLALLPPSRAGRRTAAT